MRFSRKPPWRQFQKEGERPGSIVQESIRGWKMILSKMLSAFSRKQSTNQEPSFEPLQNIPKTPPSTIQSSKDHTTTTPGSELSILQTQDAATVLDPRFGFILPIRQQPAGDAHEEPKSAFTNIFNDESEEEPLTSSDHPEGITFPKKIYGSKKYLNHLPEKGPQPYTPLSIHSSSTLSRTTRFSSCINAAKKLLKRLVQPLLKKGETQEHSSDITSRGTYIFVPNKTFAPRDIRPTVFMVKLEKVQDMESILNILRSRDSIIFIDISDYLNKTDRLRRIIKKIKHTQSAIRGELLGLESSWLIATTNGITIQRPKKTWSESIGSLTRQSSNKPSLYHS